MSMHRRQFLALAASYGAALAWPRAHARSSAIRWTERRDLYPHGVASGDPHPDSVILWMRRPPADTAAKTLRLEIAADPEFRRVVAGADATIAAEIDWTCRVLAAGLAPARVYWYRFTDEHGFGSRIRVRP